MTSRPAGPRGTLGRGLTAAMLLVLVAGCSGGEPSAKPPAAPPPSGSVGEQPTLHAKPVATEVTVAKVVGGRLNREQRNRLQTQVRGLVSRYFDDAFLGGDYPRKDFADALATFSPGAALRARGDRALLTNADIGTTTQAVVARKKQVRLDVLVPGRRVAGLTARIRLVFLRQPTDGANPDQLVTVSGRLLVNRKKSGQWQIFGYDVSRSSAPAGKGAS